MEQINLDEFKNQIVVITIDKDKEVPYLHGEFIALLKFDERFNTYLINHPYNIATKFTECGEGTLIKERVSDIRKANTDEIDTWVKEYEEFHKSIIEEKGYDSCSVNLNEINLKG